MRTLIVRQDGAGDVLLAGPAVRAAAASSDHTALLCAPRGAWAARLLPGVDEVLVHDAPWMGFDAPQVRADDLYRLVRRIAARRYDRALILVSFHQSPLPAALLLRAAGVPWIGADSVDHPGSLLDLRHQRAEHLHEAEAALELARTAGCELPAGDDGRLRVLPPPDTGALTGPGRYLVLHPGAAVPARALGPERAERLAAALSRDGHRAVVTGAPGERELTARVARAAGAGGLDLGGVTGPAELAGVLARADAVLVGNTGPAHLAAALGRPIVSFFAPVVPAERWRPYGVPHALLGRQDAPCAGSRARECPVPGHPCLDSVPDAEVLAAVQALTSGDRPEPAPAAAALGGSDPR